MSIRRHIAARIAALALLATTAVVGATTNADAATGASGIGVGYFTASCTANHITAFLNEFPGSGLTNQAMYQEVQVYSYTFKKWTVAYTGTGQSVAYSGEVTTTLDWPGLPSGRYAVYATFWWYYNGWQSRSIYAAYSQYSSALLRQVNSSTCYA
jgi:hypothetical protein